MTSEVKWYLYGETHYLSREAADKIIAEMPSESEIGVHRGQLKYDKRDDTYSVIKLVDRPVQDGQKPWNGRITLI
jgi:hypothetical protein